MLMISTAESTLRADTFVLKPVLVLARTLGVVTGEDTTIFSSSTKSSVVCETSVAWELTSLFSSSSSLSVSSSSLLFSSTLERVGDLFLMEKSNLSYGGLKDFGDYSNIT